MDPFTTTHSITFIIHYLSPLSDIIINIINSTFNPFAHLSSLITSTKWASLFSLKFLARSWIRAEWSMPGPAVPVPPVMPRLVPVPVLVLVFFSFSWSMSHRELWLARTGSSSGGLRRPLAALGLCPGMNWKRRRTGWRKRRERRFGRWRRGQGRRANRVDRKGKWQQEWLLSSLSDKCFQGVLDKCTCAATVHCVLYLGTSSLVLFLAAIQHSHIITLLCSRRQGHTTGHTGRLEREKDSGGSGWQIKTDHTEQAWNII